MRLDHIAYRVKDRNKTAQFFVDAFGYQYGNQFRPFEEMGEGHPDYETMCHALVPPEKVWDQLPWTHFLSVELHSGKRYETNGHTAYMSYHMAPEIFVSDGPEGSIVGDWVERRDNIGGIHHMAYQVDDVQKTMNEWKEKGYAEFLSDNPLVCKKDPGLTQVFTSPHQLTGVIYEFIKRGEDGFCQASVAGLMESTKECK